ncbi:hypothetical protein MLD38_030393 [Melastoma candidum]|uniref:Uncharacterized protein n=1 Tax=Melastoma candidum TaxID=119954 RepID=A0ACB9MLH1_9MYRT|nr:hypothetical protein MLD38_030393 [Melastoma candidum]
MSSSGHSQMQAVPASDPFELLGVKLNPDDTLSRPAFPDMPAMSDPDLPIPILSKDVPVNPSRRTWFRVLLPRDRVRGPPGGKLPLVVYFHGGGFILFSAASAVLESLFEDLVLLLPAVVVSVEYRLAPEHRLPAAYDDALEALEVIRTTKDEWISTYADLSNCYLMGGSSGGNIAYHTGLRVATGGLNDLKPLNIRGLILHQPFFGGMKRTESELRLFHDRALPAVVTDLMWELALPIGADRDHEYCNPTTDSNPGLAAMEKVRSLGWRVLVAGSSGDPLIDRQVELVKVMEEKGVSVVSHFIDGHCHGAELSNREGSMILARVIKDFMSVTTMGC